MSVDLTNIKTGYFEANAEEILTTANLSPKSARLFSIQTGVKAPTTINLLNTTIAFGNGKSCGWNEAGQSAISQRTITPGHIKISMSFCHRQFLDTFASYKVNVSPDEETLPFEEWFAKDIVNKVGTTLENAIWQGDTASSNTNVNTNKFDGLAKILNADVPSANKATATSGQTIKDRVYALYSSISGAVLPNAIIAMSISNYRALVLELMNENLYHYKTDVNNDFEFVLAGTNTKVIGLAGLEGSNVIYAFDPKNIVYGVDVDSSETDVKMWYSEDNDEFRLRMAFSAGVQVAFPSEVWINNPYSA